MSVLKSKFQSFILSIAQNMNALNQAISNKVSVQIFNNQTTFFNNTINELTNDLNESIEKLEFFEGMKFTSNPAGSLIYLKNGRDETITELNVGFLNNEGTQFNYNATTQNLELKNDQGEVLSTIPISSFVTNLATSLNFNSVTPSILELKSSNGTIVSSLNIGINNVQNLEARLNSFKTIYNSDDSLTGHRVINLLDKSLRFQTLTDTVEFKDNKVTVPSLYTNKFQSTQSGQILSFLLNNNLPKVIFGNDDINELEINSKKLSLKNIKILTNQDKTLVINSAGELGFKNGIGIDYVPGTGISIVGNVISVIPTDSIELEFNW